MKTMQKNFLSLFLAVIMIVSVIPMGTITASAAESWLWPLENYKQWTTYEGHRGIDIPAPSGTPIRASKSGTLYVYNNTCNGSHLGASPACTISGCNSNTGKCVYIIHNDGTASCYMHLVSLAITSTKAVKQGDIIGYVGTTGPSTGNHLHFEAANGSGSNYWSYSLMNPGNLSYIYNTNVTTTGITLNSTQFTMKVGEIKTITASVSPSNATNKTVTWSSNAPSIATVDSKGTIKGVSSGACTITAKTSGGQTASCLVVIKNINPALVAFSEYNGHYYELYDEVSSWHDAKTDCENFGGHLVTISSANENNAVWELMKKGNKDRYYIGITDEKTEGQWLNVTGETSEYFNWADGEPNPDKSIAAIENYGFINKDTAKWGDIRDYQANPNVTGYICEYDSPIKADAVTVIDGKVYELYNRNYGALSSDFATYVGAKAVDKSAVDTAVANWISAQNVNAYAFVLEYTLDDWLSQGNSLSDILFEELPDGADPNDYDIVTEYRSKDKSTTTSTAASMDGWTKYDSKTTYGAWSSTQQTTTKPTASDTLQIVNTWTQYHYYHYLNYYSGCYNIDSISYGTNHGRHTIDRSSPLSAVSLAKLTFKVKDGAAFDKTKVTVEHIESRQYDGTKNTFANASSEITVVCPHSSVKEQITKQPTHTAAGTKAVVCNTCGKTIKTESIPATGHSYGAWTVTKAATCTAKGVETRACSCGATETREIAMKAHTAGKWEVKTAPTCTEKGTEVQKCTVCGTVMNTRETEAKGHTFGEWTIVKDATCTEKGEKKSVCTVCGKAVTEEIAAKGHTPIATEWCIIKEATCTTPAVGSVECAVCHEWFSREIPEIYPALGHKYGEWKVTKEATDTAEGEKERVCSVCGEKETEKIPALNSKPANPQNPDIPNTAENTVVYAVISALGILMLFATVGISVYKLRKKQFSR